jgi:chorismate dehydratase
MIRISAVSYLNTKPFLYGLRKANLPNVAISVDIPSECARKLLTGEVDLGLVPVAIIPQLAYSEILPGFCIGADGPVDSVKLYSQVPLNEIKTILCDYQSRTSVMLARILAKEFWKINPEWKNAETGYEATILGNTAGIIIGDRTFSIEGKFKYEYDLSEEWKKHTGLPFVFAAWVSNTKLPATFIKEFGHALAIGISEIDQVVTEEKSAYPDYDVAHYLKSALKFELQPAYIKAMELYLEKVAHVQI